MIELSHVCKSYGLPHGRKVVLDNVSHIFREGVNMGILGLNGAGKSTLMRVICGAESPDKGRVKRTSRVSWPIGFSGGFHGSLTGRENMRFTCRIYGANIKQVTALHGHAHPHLFLGHESQAGLRAEHGHRF